MIIVIESVVLCLVFTLMVYLMSREPIKTLYNYPPKIQERVRTLPEYKDKIPTQKNKLAAKLGACVLFVVVLSLILRYVNGYTTFLQAFGFGFLLWTVVNLWDVIVLDILWFCHDPHFGHFHISVSSTISPVTKQTEQPDPRKRRRPEQALLR